MYQLVPSIPVACNWWSCMQNPLVTYRDWKTSQMLVPKAMQHHPQRHNIKIDWQANKVRMVGSNRGEHKMLTCISWFQLAGYVGKIPRCCQGDNDAVAWFVCIRSSCKCPNCLLNHACNNQALCTQFACQVQMLRGESLKTFIHWFWVLTFTSCSHLYKHSWRLWWTGHLIKALEQLQICHLMQKTSAKRPFFGRFMPFHGIISLPRWVDSIFWIEWIADLVFWALAECKFWSNWHIHTAK